MDDTQYGKLAILCVDDDPLILSSLSEQLSYHLAPDIAIELAKSGEEALQILALLNTEQTELALLLSDQQMSGMTGDQLLQQVHQVSPNTLTILLTGTRQVEVLGNAVNLAQLYRYIPKPWDEADLVLTVKEAIRRYRQDQAIASHQLRIQATNAELASSVSLLRATLEATADGILVVNNQGLVTHVNHKFLDGLGYSTQGIVDEQSPNQLAELQNFLDNPANPWQQLLNPIEHEKPGKWITLELDDGRLFECHGQVQQLSQQVVGCVWSIRDMTEHHRTSQLIHYQAHHDALTGLYNRSHFLYHVEALLQSTSGSQLLAVLFLDLDRFKMVNDTLGHSVGDCLLKAVVQRLQRCCRTGDIISRWGGDEFTIVTPRIRDRQDVVMIAQRFLEIFKSCFEINGHTIRITISIGAALYPEDGNSVETLLKHADAALYKAKEAGKNTFQFYTTELSDRAHERLRLETAMYQSLEDEDFVLNYQPQMDTLTGEITHLEALVRWRHPTLGMIAPGTFIDIAEQNGLIIPLGKWVFKTALTQLQHWHGLGYSGLKIAINLSPLQLLHPDLLSTVEQLLIETRIPPQCLELEVTETAMMTDLSTAQLLLTQLQALGTSIALDDFGTGYASLAYLQQLPFDTLKIDRSFVGQLSQHPESTPQSQAIIEAVLALGRGLQIRVVAEGVETAMHYQLLQSLGCRYMQGFYFSRPLPAAEITVQLQSSAPFIPTPSLSCSSTGDRRL